MDSTSKGEQAARKWAAGIWFGIYPGQKLPFGIAPTTEGARGSDLIIEGIAEGVTINLDEFRLS